jgi:hypothetical protein
MAGTIPLSMTQQFDEFGKPLAGGKLIIYQAGTVATPQQAFQDVGLTILQPYPMTLDAAGRVPLFYLADGFIKFNLTNAAGIPQLAKDNVLVIGPSSGGGGGGSVDPTTLIQTGMLSLYYGVGVLSGYVRANGRTIGNALSGATESAAAATQALWIFLYNADPNLAVSGGRTGNALNDYNANKTIVLPDWRGCTIAGLDDMGSSVAGRLSAAFFGVVATVLGAFGGGESNLLGPANIPLHKHAAFVKVTDPGHAHGILDTNAGGSGRADLSNFTPVFFQGGTNTAVNTQNKTTGITALNSSNGVANDNQTGDNAGGGGAHANVQPTRLCTIYLKL